MAVLKMNNDKIRAFWAFEMPENLKKIIYFKSENLRKIREKIKWVERENLHITAKFLGDSDRKILAKSFQEISSYFTDKKKIEFEISLKGIFPSLNSPKVLWLGTKTENNEFTEYANIIENILAAYGFQKEKRGFKAHLTLGRVREIRDLQVFLKEWETLGLPENKFLCDKIVLFESQLTQYGPVYKKINSISLI